MIGVSGGTAGGWRAGRRAQRTIYGAALVTVLTVMCSGCTSETSRGPPTGAQMAGRHRAVITVGAFDFPESVLLAHIYGDALKVKGFPVRVLPGLGSRELVDPALLSGLIQLVPEYAGSALQFNSLGRQSATSDVMATSKALTELMADQGVVAGLPAGAQNTNAIVVRAATAARYGLRSIADLARVAPRLTFGGPPECPGRAYCLPGLKQAYGLRFKAFIPLDAGGPLTLQALTEGNVDVALLFSTDPSISARHLAVLADDRGLQPAENVTPLVSGKVVTRYGAGLVAALNAVSARLGAATLRALDARVEIHGQDPRQVADGWLRAQGLPGGRGWIVEREYRGRDLAGRARRPPAQLGCPPHAPPAPPDGRAPAAAAPVHRQHGGVADPRNHGSHRRVPGVPAHAMAQG
jgi:osmoprotectant transport system substrate-binding protein